MPSHKVRAFTNPSSETIFPAAPIPNANASIKGTNLSALTNAQGQFRIGSAPVGDIVLFVDGSTSTRPEIFPTLSFQMVTLPGIDNALAGPIFLPPIDTDNSQVVGGDQDVVLTMKGVPGVAYTVFAHSATFPDGSKVGRMMLSQVHADRVPMIPANGTAPTLVATLQPAGVAFDPPIRMQMTNTDGLPPGQVVEIFGFRHDLEQFVSEGTARVSDDGSVIVSDPGFGLRVSGWHDVPRSGSPPTGCARNVIVNILDSPSGLNVGDQAVGDALGSGDSAELGCPANPGQYTWSSDSPDLLAVAGNGPMASLVASAPGRAGITVTYTAGGKIATNKATVQVVNVKVINVDATDPHAVRVTYGVEGGPLKSAQFTAPGRSDSKSNIQNGQLTFTFDQDSVPLGDSMIKLVTDPKAIVTITATRKRKKAPPTGLAGSTACIRVPLQEGNTSGFPIVFVQHELFEAFEQVTYSGAQITPSSQSILVGETIVNIRTPVIDGLDTDINYFAEKHLYRDADGDHLAQFMPDSTGPSILPDDAHFKSKTSTNNTWFKANNGLAGVGDWTDVLLDSPGGIIVPFTCVPFKTPIDENVLPLEANSADR